MLQFCRILQKNDWLWEIRYHIFENARQTKPLTVVTTFLDEKPTKEEIAELYGFRWNVELDLRCAS